MTVRRSVSELKNKHRGLDIWIVGGGASANWITPEFLVGKLSIGINGVHRKFRTNYLIRKDARLPTDEPTMQGIPLILSEFDCSNYAKPRNDVPGAYYFEHVDNAYGHSLDLSVIGTNKILVAYSTLASAMHVACEMGAKNIIVVGCDAGSIDGTFYFVGYDDEPVKTQYGQFLWEHVDQIRRCRDALTAHYGVPIYSLSPFVGLTTDGHRFESPEQPPRCKHCGCDRTEFRCRVPGNARFYHCPTCHSISSTLSYEDVAQTYLCQGYLDHYGCTFEESCRQVNENVRMIEAAGVDLKTVLDVGCFDGAMLRRLMDLGYDASGWDVNPYTPERVAKNCEIAPSRVMVGTEFLGCGRQFDVVVSREVLEHTPDHRRHFAALAASVNPGGVLHLQTPRPHDDYSFSGTYNSGHLAILSPEAVESLFHAHGLAIEQRKLWEQGQAYTGRKPAC